MNYKRIYDLIIERAKERLLTGYYEKHHIIPRCMNGTDDLENIVSLTAKEHYIVHRLLIKIYPENKKLICAFWMMCNGSKKCRIPPSPKAYEEAKILFSKYLKNRVPTFKGKHHSEETKKKISISKKGQDFWTGRKHSEESKIKQSISAKNRNIIEENEKIRREGISKNNLGKKLTMEHRIIISNSKIGNKNPMFNKTGKNNPRSKPILQYDLNNNFIREWENGLLASKELNISYGGINLNANNKSKTSGKFIWKFKD